MIKRLHKIKINEEDEEMERAMSMGEEKEREKEQKKVNSAVFKVFSKMIENRKDERVTLKELLEEMEDMNQEELRQSLRSLDKSQKLLFDEEKGNIHSV